MCLWEVYFNKIIPKTKKQPLGSCKDAHHQGEFSIPKSEDFLSLCRFCWIYVDFLGAECGTAVYFQKLTLQQAPSRTMIASNSSSSGGNFSHFPPKREYNFCPKVLKKMGPREAKLEWNLEMICTWNPKQPFFNGCLVKPPFIISYDVTIFGIIQLNQPSINGCFRSQGWFSIIEDLEKATR